MNISIKCIGIAQWCSFSGSRNHEDSDSGKDYNWQSFFKRNPIRFNSYSGCKDLICSIASNKACSKSGEYTDI